MCGLSGIFGTIGGKDYDVFKNLLYFNTVRGEDSTGVGIIPRYPAGQDIRTIKILGPACDLVNHTKFEKTLNHGWHTGWLGHNRSATTGSISIRNCHPFQFDNVLGMHNGTIEHHCRSKLKDHLSFGTDSEALIWNIELFGVEKTISQVEGSWTLIWYEKKAHTLNMLRNEKRPLAYVFSKDHKVLYFGSELDTLSGALRRNFCDKQPLSEVIEKFWILPDNIWYSWKIPKDGMPFEEPVRTRVEGYKYIPQKINHAQYKREDSSSTNSAMKPGFTQEVLSLPSKSQTTNASNDSGPTLTRLGRKAETNKPDPSTLPGWIPDPEDCKGFFPYMRLNQTRIYRNFKNNTWMLATWQSTQQMWNIKETRQAPKFLKFTLLDINANHFFKHVGKKKKKVIYCKGWKGQHINRLEFEMYAKCGCASCGRSDVEWGNQVLWVNKDHQFLCEFCMMDAPLVRSWFGHDLSQPTADPTKQVALN